MKILSAEFENFRLLKDLKINFSNASEKNLTVIRAANASGKTTMLTALQWALYGDASLPGSKGKTYRLSPLDAKDKDIQITVAVEFEVTKRNKTPSGEQEIKKIYKIIRSVHEFPDDLAARKTSTAQLYQIRDARGATLIENPAPIISDELPPELREIFFTDGDRALSFIDEDTNQLEKRKRVESAIRSLLGIEMVEKAIAHVKKAEKNLNTKIRKSNSDGKLGDITSRLEGIEKNISKEGKKLEVAREEIFNFGEKLKAIEKDILENLKKGDQEQLKKELERLKKQRIDIDKKIKEVERSHSNLFRNHALANDLIEKCLQPVFAELDRLHDEKKIPSVTIPILFERLEIGICICGEKLDSNDEDTQHRIKHIKELIKTSEESDNVQKIITNLYFYFDTVKRRNKDGSLWREQYEEIAKIRNDFFAQYDSIGRNQVEVEKKIDALGNTNITALREMEKSYQEKRSESVISARLAETKLKTLDEQKKELIGQRDDLLKQVEENGIFLAERDVISDVLGVFEGTFNQIKSGELDKVSNEMNRLFLEMIGHDPDQNSLATIHRSEISHEFDIIVYGATNNRVLVPDTDLNGASRRALTLAFILALSKVSEVAAPNVIDTPLAMAAGHVRRAMLKAAVRESKQLILFLTHDEIKGCEDIIDKEAGAVFTLTNSAHYPTMLVNNPNVDEAKILRCLCSHQETCEICERRDDNAVESESIF